MNEDPRQRCLDLVNHVVAELTAQQVELLRMVRALRAQAAPADSRARVGAPSTTALARPMRRDYDYFTELERRLSDLRRDTPDRPPTANGNVRPA